MEVLFAIAGCLGAFALGLAANRLCAARPQDNRAEAPPEQEDLPPGLKRQWQDFLQYDGRGGTGYEED